MSVMEFVVVILCEWVVVPVFWCGWVFGCESFVAEGVRRSNTSPIYWRFE